MLLKLPPKLHDPCLSTMNFLNEVVLNYPKAISFAPGRPQESFFDVTRELGKVSRFVAHYHQVLGCSQEATYNYLGQYGKTNGIISDLVADHLFKDEQIKVDPAAISVTVGCQEAMAMLLMTLFQPGNDVLLVSDPSYVGITGVARILGVDLIPVPMCAGDLRIEDVAEALDAALKAGKRPRALYHVPDFNNPIGSSMSLENRYQLLALSKQRDFLIFEDNPYGMFVYDGDPLPTLKSLDTEHRVIYMGTFSKTLFPGLRVGYVVADQEVQTATGNTLLADELSKVKSFLTVNTSPLLQAVVGGILLEQEGSLRKLIEPKVAFYKQNRNCMITCLERELYDAGISPEQVAWNNPSGGFFLTLTLPFHFDEASVRACADQYGAIVCPMSLFSLRPSHTMQIRLSFSYVNRQQIEQGIAGLSRFIKAQLSMM